MRSREGLKENISNLLPLSVSHLAALHPSTSFRYQISLRVILTNPKPSSLSIGSVNGNVVSTVTSSYVTTLRAFSLCWAPSGKIAAPQTKPIAGFPGSSEEEGILPAIKPAGISSAKGQFAIHAVDRMPYPSR